MDWGKPDKWDDPANRVKISNSFQCVANWAKATEDCFDPSTMQQAYKAAVAAGTVLSVGNPSTLLSYMGGVREDFRFLVELQTKLHERPDGDPHRCNPALRTALRRIDDYLTSMGATFQYC